MLLNPSAGAYNNYEFDHYNQRNNAIATQTPATKIAIIVDSAIFLPTHNIKGNCFAFLNFAITFF